MRLLLIRTKYINVFRFLHYKFGRTNKAQTSVNGETHSIEKRKQRTIERMSQVKDSPHYFSFWFFFTFILLQLLNETCPPSIPLSPQYIHIYSIYSTNSSSSPSGNGMAAASANCFSYSCCCCTSICTSGGAKATCSTK